MVSAQGLISRFRILCIHQFIHPLQRALTPRAMRPRGPGGGTRSRHERGFAHLKLSRTYADAVTCDGSDLSGHRLDSAA